MQLSAIPYNEEAAMEGDFIEHAQRSKGTLNLNRNAIPLLCSNSAHPRVRCTFGIPQNENNMLSFRPGYDRYLG
jgi:hypothetical protein